jgi:hypothetical protein
LGACECVVQRWWLRTMIFGALRWVVHHNLASYSNF